MASENESVAAGEQTEISIDRIANGGEGVGRLDDGIVCFVSGALPGDRVVVTLTERRKRFSRGEIAEIVTASPIRTAPTCPHVADGCGGCDWQHVVRPEQATLKRQIVTDALERIGRLDLSDVAIVSETEPVALSGRTTVRALVDPLGRAGYRRRHSHDQVIADTCEVAHPAIEVLLRDGVFAGCHEVVLRVSASTGETMVIADPGDEGVEVDEGVTVVGRAALNAGTAEAFFTESVGGREWRVSADSFFQTRPEGADRLVSSVRTALELLDPAPGRLIDLYAGVGVLGGCLAGDRPLTAVESSSSAVADAFVNLADLDATIIKEDVSEWIAEEAAVVVADPSRSGLGSAGVTVINETDARAAVLVSCDAGSLGRDAALLVKSGWTLHRADVVDMFPHTSHLEVVSAFSR